MANVTKSDIKKRGIGGDSQPMKTIHWKPSKRQEEALELLHDRTHTEIFYGGGA